MENEPDLDIEIDDNFRGVLVIGCPKCRAKSKRPLASLQSDAIVGCPCGFNMEISGDGFTSAQRGFSDLKRALDDFGKF